jgi:ribose transport system substrate-binding protein
MVARARQFFASHSGSLNQWTGPTSGPRAQKGKNIAYIPTNEAWGEWNDGVRAAAKAIGWNLTLLDAAGAADGASAAMDEAVSRGVHGVITSFPSQAIQPAIQRARAKEIEIVGIHSAPGPGAILDLGLFWNVSQDPAELGKALADYAIADSNGRARIVILYDSAYPFAVAKAEAMRAEIQRCETCRVLEYLDSPLAEITTTMPQLVTRVVELLGQDLYILTIADIYIDFLAPALRAAGVAQTAKLAGMDGISSAYERIRRGDEYQTATLPLAYQEDAYQAIDELNRAFARVPPSGFIGSVHLVTKDNIEIEGGSNNEWTPSTGFVSHYERVWGV